MFQLRKKKSLELTKIIKQHVKFLNQDLHSLTVSRRALNAKWKILLFNIIFMSLIKDQKNKGQVHIFLDQGCFTKIKTLNITQ
jgi:hypothetical protein